MTGIKEDIANALKHGDYQELAVHFSSTVDLAVEDTEDLFSKAQAEQIVKGFFARHTPVNFQAIHSGTSKSGLEYVIGNLETKEGTYRVTYYLKKEGDQQMIHQLRFDEEE